MAAAAGVLGLGFYTASEIAKAQGGSHRPLDRRAGGLHEEEAARHSPSQPAGAVLPGVK